ncbi:MAG TPA: alpha/beta hydrolase [Candidatus Limnocylindrales bacterium]|nr:alpha/beta hydrolase [Candidatus Limnocylindrales bacterium]
MDPASEPTGYVVVADSGDRIHFLDWGGPAGSASGPGVVLVHGLSNTAWSWAPVARRMAAMRRTVAMDLRGHGLSDSPTSRYELETLGGDVVAVAEGSGALASGKVTLAGHGFGGIVAAWAAAELGDRCARLVLVDGGWEDVAGSTGMEPDEFLRGLDEPPEVLRSMRAYLADRAGFDPATWDADQERAARATVVETPAGRVVPATRPHALVASVEAMFRHRPAEILSQVTGPIVALAATTPPPGPDLPPIEVVRLDAVGHNLIRYRPDDVAAAILGR